MLPDKIVFAVRGVGIKLHDEPLPPKRKRKRR